MNKAFFTLILCAAQLLLSAQSLQFQIPNLSFSVGDTVRARFFTYGYQNIGGFQFAMQADANTLQISHIECLSPLQAGHFTFWGMPGFNLQTGEIRSVFTDTYGSNMEDGTNLFTIVFVALQNGTLSESLSVWGNHPLLYPYAGTAIPNAPIPFDISFTETGQSTSTTSAEQPEVFTISPNPAVDTSVLCVELSHPQSILLNIYDAKGYMVFGELAYHSGGKQYYTLTFPLQSGVYYVRVQHDDTCTVKTIVKN